MLKPTAIATAISGTLDILFAMVLTLWFGREIPNMLRYVASGPIPVATEMGAAGAILSPSVFSITLVTFEEGAERNKALGILGGIAGSGAAIGVLLGGVFTEYIGWEWIFFVNVPIAAAALTVIVNRQSDGYAYVPVP